MLEVIIVSIILGLSIFISLIIFHYLKLNMRRPLDYYGWGIGMLIWNIFLLIIGIATIINYLQIS